MRKKTSIFIEPGVLDLVRKRAREWQRSIAVTMEMLIQAGLETTKEKKR